MWVLAVGRANLVSRPFIQLHVMEENCPQNHFVNSFSLAGSWFPEERFTSAWLSNSATSSSNWFCVLLKDTSTTETWISDGGLRACAASAVGAGPTAGLCWPNMLLHPTPLTCAWMVIQTTDCCTAWRIFRWVKGHGLELQGYLVWNTIF